MIIKVMIIMMMILVDVMVIVMNTENCEIHELGNQNDETIKYDLISNMI